MNLPALAILHAAKYHKVLAAIATERQSSLLMTELTIKGHATRPHS